MERKNKNLRLKDIDQDDNIDYTIASSNVISNIAKFENQLGGGNDEVIDMTDYVKNLTNNDKKFNHSHELENIIYHNEILQNFNIHDYIGGTDDENQINEDIGENIDENIELKR